MKLHSILLRLGIVAITLSLFFLPGPTEANIVTFDLGYVFSGGPLGGTAPWLRATFDDGGTPGSVTLTMSAVGLTGQFVDGNATATPVVAGGWFFSFNPAKNIGSLTYSFVSGNDADRVDIDINGSTQPNLLANDSGLYDIRFQWDNDAGPPNKRFRPGQTATYTFSGISDLVASDFYFLSTGSASVTANGRYYSAARIQGGTTDGIPPDPGWVGASPVPEPGIL